MVEFNPDGSIKLSEQASANQERRENKMRKEHCVMFKREVISTYAPKKCKIHMQVSLAFPDLRFVDTIYGYFKNDSEVPSRITKISDREFEIEIGTAFSRCSDCTGLISRFREFLNGNIIDDPGTCTYKGRFGGEGGGGGFSYEDYF